MFPVSRCLSDKMFASCRLLLVSDKIWSCSPKLSTEKCRGAHGLFGWPWPGRPLGISFINLQGLSRKSAALKDEVPVPALQQHVTWAEDSLLSWNFPISQTRWWRYCFSRSTPAYFMNLPYQGHVPRLQVLSGGYGNIPRCNVRQGHLWHESSSTFYLDGGLGETVCQPNRMGSAVHGNSQAFGDVRSFYVGLYT